jgi:hypothetical protein
MRIHIAMWERPILTGVASASEAESRRVLRRVEVKEVSGEGEGSEETTFLCEIKGSECSSEEEGESEEAGARSEALVRRARLEAVRLTNWSTA